MPNVTMYSTNGLCTTQDNRWTPADGGLAKQHTTDIAGAVDIASLDTLLASLNGTYWTTARLNQENLWDKLYWLRATRRSSASLT